MGSSGNNASLDRQRAALRAGLVLLLVLAPLPFGGVGAVSVLGLQWFAAALGALALTILARDPEGLPRPARPLLIPAGVLLAVGVAQWIPLPAALTSWTAAPTAEMRLAVAEVLPGAATRLTPYSLDPNATLDAVLRLTAYLLIGLSTVVAVRRRAHLAQVGLAVSLSAAFQALYGSAEYLSGHQHIFGFAKQFYTDNATGTFINRNHFAGYLAMGLPLALGLALQLSSRHTGVRQSWRERLLSLGEPAGLRVLAGMFAAGAIWAGIVLSYSRSGMAAGLLASGFVLFHSTAWRRHARVLAVILLVPTALLLWQEIRAPGERYFEQTEIVSLAGRLPVWRASVGMVPDYPVLGTGLGTFEGAFALYRPAEVRKLWNHAHNDWLQSLTEGGIVVFVAVIALLVLALWRRGRSAASLVALAPVHAGLLAIAVQSTIDFSLRIPANAALCACLVGLTCIREKTVDSSVTRLPGRASGRRTS